MAELKPCPFCGSRNVVLCPSIRSFSKLVVGCLDCNATSGAQDKTPERYELIEGDMYKRIPEVTAEENAIAAWNRRASDG